MDEQDRGPAAKRDQLKADVRRGLESGKLSLGMQRQSNRSQSAA